MSKQWQVVDEEGEVVHIEDDASSIASDWSMVGMDSDLDSPTRSRSLPRTDASSRQNDLTDAMGASSRSERRHPSLPNSLDSPVRQNPEDQASITPTQSGAISPMRAGARAVRSSGSSRLATDASASHVANNDYTVDPVKSRQTAARWNATAHANRRRGNRNAQNVDAQRTKCFRRGAQTSTGYQRQQVRLASGGVIPQARQSGVKKH